MVYFSGSLPTIRWCINVLAINLAIAYPFSNDPTYQYTNTLLQHTHLLHLIPSGILAIFSDIIAPQHIFVFIFVLIPLI